MPDGVSAEGRCRRSSSKDGRGTSISRERYHRHQVVVVDLVNKSTQNKRPRGATGSEVQELAN